MEKIVMLFLVTFIHILFYLTYCPLDGFNLNQITPTNSCIYRSLLQHDKPP